MMAEKLGFLGGKEIRGYWFHEGEFTCDGCAYDNQSKELAKVTPAQVESRTDEELADADVRLYCVDCGKRPPWI